MPWPKHLKAIVKRTPRGIRVFLNKFTWFEHICGNHPEVRNRLADVLITLEHPDETYAFRKNRYSFRYFLKRGSFIMLIYRVAPEGRLGRVKTAYCVVNPYLEVTGYSRVWPI